MVKGTWKVVNGYGPYGYLQKSVKDGDKVKSVHIAYLGKAGTNDVFPGMEISVPPSEHFEGGLLRMPLVADDLKKSLRDGPLESVMLMEQRLASVPDDGIAANVAIKTAADVKGSKRTVWKRSRDNPDSVDIDIGEDRCLLALPSQGSDEPPRRRNAKDSGVVRDPALSRFLKDLYDYQCQICRFTITILGEHRYAETHHIRPLGGGHRGIDKLTNMMVLCPNHHSMMDLGAIAIDPDSLTVIAQTETGPEHQQPLQLEDHHIGREFLLYHLEHIFGK